MSGWRQPRAAGPGGCRPGQAAAASPRLSPDGGLVAWTGSLAGATEIYVASTQEGGGERLTYWGEDKTRVRGWSRAGEILAVSAAGQPFDFMPAAHVIRPDAGGAAAADTRLPFGPVLDLAADDSTLALLTSGLWRDPAAWKRYRGGTAGRMWIRDAGGLAADGPAFTQILAGLGGQIACPMLAGGRLAFLSDHEGTANIYSCALDGTGLRRHTDHDGSYARQAATDGQRIVYCCAGQVWMLDSLDAAAPSPWRSGWAPPGGRRGWSPPTTTSARSAWTRPAGPARWRYAAPCTG